MKVSTKTYIMGLICIFFNLPAFSANIAIIESQSFHPFHKMDDNWKNAAQRLGHDAEIFTQDILDNTITLCDHDLIIIASGLTDLNSTQRNNLTQYIQAGISVYIQSEYLHSTPGNVLFKETTTTLGGQFDWTEEHVGNLAPMTVLPILDSTPNSNIELSYFWYGVAGEGDDNFIPFLEHNNKNYGFIFSTPMPSYGKVITMTDQDWIRSNNNPEMLENILVYFMDNPADTSMPGILIDADEEMPCPGTTVTFTANPTFSIPVISYQWMKNGGDITGENNRQYITADLNFGDVIECRIERQLPCDQRTALSNPILVAVHNPLTYAMINIEADEPQICSDEAVTFSIRPSDYPDALNIRLQWMIDNQPVVGATDSIFVASNLLNNSSVNCLFTYDDICDPNKQILSESITVDVTALAIPDATLMADQNDICQGEQITFSILGQNLGTQPQYEWLINGTNTNITTNTPFFTTSDLEDGDLVSCNIIVDQVCAAQPNITTETLSINVMTPLTPAAYILADLSETCEGGTVTFIAEGEHLGTTPSYQWMIDGQAVGTDAPIFSSPILSSDQIISVAITSNETCLTQAVANSNTLNVITHPLNTPEVAISASQNYSCQAEPITFSANPTHEGDLPTYQWFVDGKPEGTNSPTFVHTAPEYAQEITCVLTSNAECLTTTTASSETFIIDMSNLDIAILESEGEHCGDGNGLIEVEAVGGVAPYTYLWSNGSTNNFLSELSSGEYTVTITDAYGCSRTTSQEVENILGPVIQSVEGQPTDCFNRGGSATVQIEGNTDHLTFRWTNHEGQLVGLSATATNLTAGKYTVGVIDEYGCSSTDTVTIEDISNVILEDLEVPFLQLGEETTLNPIIITTQQLTYSWSPAIGLSCTDCPNPVASPVENTVYELTVTNEYGCSFTNKVVVKVLPNRDVYIPNAFSPNNDGVNDYFTIFGGHHVKGIKSLKIADRWGNVLFEKTKFDINDETQGWNGTLRGKTLGAGVYIYIAEVEYIDGKAKWYKGDISITP